MAYRLLPLTPHSSVTVRARKLWMAYRLLPSTPLVQFLMRIGVLWIAYGLLPSTPGLTLIGCGLWMAHGLPPLTPGTTKPDKAVRLWMARKLLPLTPVRMPWSPGICCEWLTDYDHLHLHLILDLLLRSCEWLTDYYHLHLSVLRAMGLYVVNGSRIENRNTYVPKWNLCYFVVMTCRLPDTQLCKNCILLSVLNDL